MESSMFTIKDWIYLVGLGLTAGTFVWKLITDTSIARFRETIAYIEKREEKMRERWAKLKAATLSGSELEEEMRVFFNQLELVSLLVDRGAFDAEVVYNYWWRFFDEPLAFQEINTWVLLHQTNDSAVFLHYVRRCKAWAERIDVECGRSKPRSWWRRILQTYERRLSSV